VPYVVRGIERFFDRPEVRQAVLMLRGAGRAAGGDQGGRDGATDGMPGQEGLAAAVRAVLSGNGWSPTAPAGSGRAREQWESLAALAALAEEYQAAHPNAALPEFVHELEERAAVQHAPVVDGVTLASLHSAKGLEWDAVHLVGLTEGLMPITYAETDEQVEEERRLLYVGVTRARERLHLSWALARAPGGRRSRKPSRFLDGVRPAAFVADRPKTAKKGLSDDPVVQRLAKWRKQRADDDGVPAYVVFDNKTIEAIAEYSPEDKSALAAVPGIGPAKLEKYGDEVLDLLRG
jgi:DNA helicase-2/ATP-dependent DNA helicase PcrA